MWSIESEMLAESAVVKRAAPQRSSRRAERLIRCDERRRLALVEVEKRIRKGRKKGASKSGRAFQQNVMATAVGLSF
jgi:hypothetical protein